MQPTTRSKHVVRFDLWFMLAFLGILVIFIVPEIFQIQAQTRVLSTKSNLALIRDRIELFKRHHGRVPKSLAELMEETFKGNELTPQTYLNGIPEESISDRQSVSRFKNLLVSGLKTDAEGDGGWSYDEDAGEVHVNVHKKLGRRWGEFSGEMPSQW